ncbi:MAG: calcium-binding protein [Pseudomonadota bacterium]
MTLRPLVLPNGNIVTVYEDNVFDQATSTNVIQMFVRVTDENGVDIGTPTLIVERTTTNTFPSASLELNGLFIDGNTVSLQVFVDEPGTYDPVNNSYSGDPVLTEAAITVSATGAVSAPVETVLTSPPQITGDFLLSRVGVLSDGTNVFHSGSFSLVTSDANFDYASLFAFQDGAALSDIVEVPGGLAVARYFGGNAFSSPMEAATLEIAFVTGPVNATSPSANVLQAPIQITLPPNIFNYVLFGEGAFPVDMVQLDNGNFVVAFSAYTNVNGGPQGIWMTVVQPDGTVVMAPQVVDDDPNAGRSQPSLQLLNGGSFILAFEESGSRPDFIVQHWSEGLELISQTQFDPASLASLDMRNVAITASGNVLVSDDGVTEVVADIDPAARPPLPIIRGSIGDDTMLDGTNDAEQILGFTGNDSIRAFAGDDEIILDTGNHTIQAGAGDDTITIELGALVIDGGAGLDVVVHAPTNSQFANTFFFDMLAGTYRTATIFDPIDQLTSIEGFEFSGLASMGVTGTATANIVRTDRGEDTVESFGGNDTVYTGRGNDMLNLGVGEDYAEAGDGNDNITAGAGFDTILAGAGNDFVSGGGNADSIEGGEGNDRLDGDVGTDNIFGGAGNDTILGGFQNDRLFGGEGDDRIQGGGQNDRILGDAGNDILFGDNGFDRLEGGAGDDTMQGGDQADNLFGGIGDDLMSGGNGFDRLFGGAGDDFLGGDAGTDGLFGEQGNDTIIGGSDNDRAFGGAGNDDISGGTGNDTMFGGAGFDTITGGAGDDAMAGNFNADTFVFDDDFGNDTITDFDANNDLERIDLSAVGGIFDFTDLTTNHMAQVGSDVVITDDSDTITLRNVSLADLNEVDFIFF